MEVKTFSEHYSATITVTLPDGNTLDIAVDCLPAIGHDVYDLSLKASVGFRVIADVEVRHRTEVK